MKNIIVGTAGHVDHGKTCLIKALTGVDTDRLKEEKKRGITIENGFADMIYGGYNISIIDVPGHERFINNMLMGIGGIDLVLLVIGLDEGVMPQTVEHFHILTMLGIDRGIIVYTKRDLAENREWVELVKDDVHSLVKGTFLEKAPEIEVSALKNENIDKLKDLIVENIDDAALKNDSSELFRLPVDRVFTIAGFGTVVTGTLIEGSIDTGSEMMVYPSEKPVKVRNIQVHNQQTDTACAGQRTAINAGGIKKETLERGSVLARGNSIETTMMVDVSLKLFDDADRTVLNNSRVHLYCGSSKVLAKVILLDRDAAEKGESVYAQLRTEKPVAFKMNDRFIIRFYSPVITIGGGKILEVSPARHKRNDPAVLKALRIKDQGTDLEVAELIIKEKSSTLITCEALALKMRLCFERGKAIAEKLMEDGSIRRIRNEYLMHRTYLEKIYDAARSILNEYHIKNQLSAGMGREEFKSRLERETRITDRKITEDLMLVMEEEKVIRSSGQTVCAYDFKITYSAEMQKLRDRIYKAYKDGGYEMPTVDEILRDEKDQANGRQLITAMASEGMLVRLSHQYYIEKEAYDSALSRLMDKLTEGGSITLAEFRDMLGTSRKFAMAILDYLDQQKITRKTDDVRVLY